MDLSTYRNQETTKDPTSDSLWINLLPTDIQLRIAKQVCEGFCGPYALTLAKSCPAQADIVICALNYTMQSVSAERQEEEMKDWLEVFKKVKVLQLSHLPSNFRLLAAPSLRVLLIEDNRCQLNALAGSGVSLERLEIKFRNEYPDTALICHALGNVAFKTLRLHDDLNAFLPEADIDKFTQACQDMETLIMYDYSMWTGKIPNLPGRQDDMVVQCIHRLPNLREICLTTSFERLLRGLETDAVLKMLGDVPIQKWTAWISRKLDASVVTQAQLTEVNLLTGECISASGFCKLEDVFRVSPMLEKLSVALVHGAESRFPKMPSLRKLEIHWMDYGHREEGYYEPDHGSILRIVDGLPDLIALQVYHVAFSEDELHAVLMKLGNRLTEFGTSFDGQDVSPSMRLLTMLKSLCKYASSLKMIHVLGDSFHDAAELDEIRDARIWLGRLRSHAPDADVGEVEELLWTWAEREIANSAS